MSETNKDEAIRAFHLGKSAFQSSDHIKAKRLFMKSISLHRTSEAEHYLFLVEQKLTTTTTKTNENNETNSNQPKQDHTSNSQHNTKTKTTEQEKEFVYTSSTNKNVKQETFKATTSTTTKTSPNDEKSDSSTPHSEKQKQEVDRILSMNDYYQILNLSKSCTEEEVKKAYKKVLFYFIF
jgi:DnaJ family protein B protein 12